MKLSTTLLFIPKANSQVNMIKYANISGLHREGQKTDITSEMHNWSSRHSTNMILNFLESLLSYL